MYFEYIKRIIQEDTGDILNIEFWGASEKYAVSVVLSTPNNLSMSQVNLFSVYVNSKGADQTDQLLWHLIS